MTDTKGGATEDTSTRLATLPRSDSEEMRVEWSEYKGHHFFSLRVWNKGSDGQWRPVKAKGCTVKRRELSALSDAVEQALALAATDAR